MYLAFRLLFRVARDGSITLTDLQAPFLHVVCEPCRRRGSYAVARLIAERGDARLTDLLPALANCSRTANPAASIYDSLQGGVRGDYSSLPSAASTRMITSV
jgi:hypothetical protein